MEVKLGNKSIELKYSLRIYMVFESMVQRAFNPSLTGDSVMLFLSALLSSDPDCGVTLDDLVDFIDDDPQLMDDFVAWYTGRVNELASKKKKKQTAKA